LINELLAPFRGLINVRDAHENLTLGQLEAQICIEIRDRPDSSILAHLMMCMDHEPGFPEPIYPTLGWALSKNEPGLF
jgi:hypothetical protein